jgi:pyruvate/2-oxoglutarate dehydrogenase complex dihydrolipoamide dehydrogenase (E3) component
MAEYQARIAVRNALFPLKSKACYDDYAWCTFTDPEFAHAGLTENEARQTFGEKIKVFSWQYRDTDRARTEAEPFGMGKFVCDRSYRLLGAHILGQGAGDLIHEAQIIKTLGIPFHRLDSIIHVYPTLSDVVRQPAKMSRIDRLRGNLFVRVVGRLLSRKPTSS